MSDRLDGTLKDVKEASPKTGWARDRPERWEMPAPSLTEKEKPI
jgi:hypothetical protein